MYVWSMQAYQKIETEFREFLTKHGNAAFKMLKTFFETQKENFYKEKIHELTAGGMSVPEATIKVRQGWVSASGRSLEVVIEILIENFCTQHNLHITNDKILRGKKLTDELDLVKRALVVHFGDYSVLPDGDIIIYQFKNSTPKILAILSIKNSFRERYTETPYWKLKLAQNKNTKHIKVFMITPDNDNEISFVKNTKKSRIVMEYELDGVYLAKDDFDATAKIKGLENLISDLEALV